MLTCFRKSRRKETVTPQGVPTHYILIYTHSLLSYTHFTQNQAYSLHSSPCARNTVCVPYTFGGNSI